MPVDEKKTEEKQLQNLDDVRRRLDEIHALEDRIASLKTTILKESSASLDDTPDDLNFLLLHSDDRLLAAPLMYIDEVIDMPRLDPLPQPIDTVAGLLNYHGTYLAVIDVRTLVGQKVTAPDPDQAIVICTVPPRRFALKVDEALEVITAREQDISIASQVLPGVLRSTGMLRVSDRQSALILDIAWLAVGAHMIEVKSTPSNGEAEGQ